MAGTRSSPPFARRVQQQDFHALGGPLAFESGGPEARMLFCYPASGGAAGSEAPASSRHPSLRLDRCWHFDVPAAWIRARQGRRVATGSPSKAMVGAGAGGACDVSSQSSESHPALMPEKHRRMMALSLVAMAAAYSPTLPHIVASRAPARAARFAPLTLDGVYVASQAPRFSPSPPSSEEHRDQRYTYRQRRPGAGRSDA